uniref:FAD-binding FR-type domain-containing protein n=1 Tax=Fusarium oxysporum (strain Fo5176) TaxID=660025 RepID=A0A0D2XFV8_FUSOF
MKFAPSLGALLINLSLWTLSLAAEDRSPERVCYDACFACLKPVHFDDVLRNQTAEDVKGVRRFEQNETDEGVLFREVVVPSEHWFGIWWDTLEHPRNRASQYVREAGSIIYSGGTICSGGLAKCHVSIFQGEYDIFFWVPCFIWVGDRVIRALRIAAFNPKLWDTWATSIYHPSSNIVRLVVPWSSSLYKPAPGTFYYIHVLNGPRCWESHPFTVAMVTDEGQRASKLLGEQVPLLDGTVAEQSSEPVDSQDILSDSRTMTFLIRPYDGFTSRLRDTASAVWPKSVPLRVLIDGPYGHTRPLHLFDNVTFIVGGSGIVVPLSYLQLLTGSTAPRSVKIHWAVREPAFALDVLQTDIADALGSTNLSVEIHLTTHTPQDELSEWPSQVTLRRGRIDASDVVRRRSEEILGESLAIVACGPAQMADDARKTVADLLRNGVMRVEYFEESFQW